jgi:uncharacterized membrane protein HdeD (DUF308 family)
MKKYKILRITRIIVYYIVGIFIILGSYLFQDIIKDNLNLLVGVSLFYDSTAALISSIKRKAYNQEENHIGTHGLNIIFSILIIISKYIFGDNTFYIICTLWGISAIINGSVRLNITIHEIAHKKFKLIECIETIESIIEIALSVFLILDPIEHLHSHVLLLGLSSLLVAIILNVHEIKNYLLYSRLVKKNELS